MQMGDLHDYTVGGTIHFIANNQIGFTTTPIEARSSLHCTELAKTTRAPIFHVNADDVENVIKVCKIAAEYRSRFKNDVVIDLIGYRKDGHNELDQPSFTQPLMYKKIKKHPNVLELYTKQLLDEGVLTEESNKQVRDKILNNMEEAYAKSRDQTFD